MAKRARADGEAKVKQEGGREYSKSQKIAYAISKRTRAKFPPAQYGTAHFLRGTPDNIARWGETYKLASEDQQALRRSHGYYGRGSYFSKAVKAGRRAWDGIGSANRNRLRDLGASAISAYNPAAGALARSYMGQGLYMGRGEYTGDTAVVANSLVQGGGRAIPKFESTGIEDGSLIVTHSEYVMDIYGNPSGESWVNTGLHINPGLTKMFPFLSQIANNFEEYEFGQLMFTYKPKLSNNITSTDGQVGSVLMYTDYNPSDKALKSKQMMMQSFGVSDGRIIDQILQGVECDPAKIKGDGHKFVRCGDVDQDLEDYDKGLFQIAVTGTPQELVNAVIGELHVSYSIVLRKPRVYTMYGFTLDKDVFLDEWTFTNTQTFSNWTRQTSSRNAIGCAYTVSDLKPGNGDISITFPASFAGTVCIEISISVNADMQWTNGIEDFPGDVSQVVLATSGLITGVETMKTNDNLPTSVGMGVAGDRLLVSGVNGWFAKITCRVEQAESGTDNAMSIQFPKPQNSSGGTAKAVMQTTVSRYNNFDSDSLVTFKPRFT